MASFDISSDERLDEIALNSLKTIPARAIVAAGVGAVASMNFGLAAGGAWTAAALLCEAWTWWVTRPHVRGAVGRAARIHYAISLVVAVSVWTALGLYAWRSPDPLQKAAAVAIWTSQLLCAASFAFQTPRGFALIAGPPALAMVIAPCLGDAGSLPGRITVVAMFLLLIAYAAVTARQTAVFRRKLDDTLGRLKQSEARAEASARAKADFLADISHELRTPLAAIIGFARLLTQSQRLEPEEARRAGLIHDASSALLGVLNDVLDASKMEAGALSLDARPFDLAGMVRDTVEVMTVQAEERRLWLWLDGPSGPVWVDGDSNRLRQILINLLSNALKFTRTGGVTVALAVEALGRTCSVRLEVRDTGIGIPREKQALLFERFAQADRSISREYGGTGLGLAICRQLIELMGGTIGVQSAEGRGATFWIEVELPAAEPPAAPAPVKPLDAPLRPMRVLAAEDHPVNRELLAALLDLHEIELTMVGDGAQAVEAVRTGAFDLVLMDVQMPVMDGLAAMRAIRMLPGEAARTPLVAMTANVLPEQVAKYKAAGANDFIGKPIDPHLLAETLARYAPR